MQFLRHRVVFARVVEAGAMRRAAAELGMTPSAVSQFIQGLEAHLGLPLLQRSTRRLALTEAGQQYYRHCRTLLAAVEAADAAVADIKESVAGSLRITAPVGLMERPLAPALMPWLRRHPQLELTLIATDAQLDFIEHRLDMAVRVGELPDSPLVAHPLGTLRYQLVAAPAYLQQRGVPESLDALAGHDWVALGTLRHTGISLLHAAGQRTRLTIQPRLYCNNLSALRQCVMQGIGLCWLPQHEAQDALRQGQLVALLPEWQPPPMPVNALTASRDLPNKVAAALVVIRDSFRDF